MSLRFAIILFDVLLLYFLFGHALWQRFLSRRIRLRLALNDMERHLTHVRHANRDILSAAEAKRLQAGFTELQRVRELVPVEAAEQAAHALHEHWSDYVPHRSHPRLKEYLEVFVVAFALAFAVRSLFLQPFKIPTGSMQPTLFGIHFVAAPPGQPPPTNPLRWVLDYVHYSRRPVHVVIKQAGYLEQIGPASPAAPLFPSTFVQVGGVRYRLPGAMENVMQYVPQISEFRRSYQPGKSLYFAEGTVLASGWLELGDHLFVNRTRYCFAEPQRGDVTVFLTDGIRDEEGRALGGRYYIKRLVGLPGDKIRIRNHKLYLCPAGQADFVEATDGIGPGFSRVTSLRGGYRGYCHFPSTPPHNCPFLTTDDDVFTVPPGRYFMLGDNSENSKDSRFWGTVPRTNLIGRAAFTWWPFSRRWGFVDVAEPADFASPPTLP